MPKWIYSPPLSNNTNNPPVDLKKVLYFNKISADGAGKHGVTFIATGSNITYRFDSQKERDNFYDNLLHFLDATEIKTDRDPLL